MFDIVTGELQVWRWLIVRRVCITAAADSHFFSDFGDLLETVATDLKVHLENPTDTVAMQRRFLLDFFGLVQHVDQPTHTHEGVLDVIITRSDCSINSLVVVSPSISDHGPVSCILPSPLPEPPVFTTRLVRGWRNFDRDQFRAALSSSFLCQDDEFYTGMNASSLFQLYEDTLLDLLDFLVPRHSVKSRSNQPRISLVRRGISVRET